MPSLSFADLRETVCQANKRLVHAGLVTLSFGNASGVDREAGVLLIKPSGVPYDELESGDLVPVALADGRPLDSRLRPSSDTPTHLALYRRYGDIGGVVHTHSTEATGWAQACRSIPALGTTHADHFHGPVPVTRQMTTAEITGEYEAATGSLIVETLEQEGFQPLEMPAVLIASHGPFCWGPDAETAVDAAIALEAVAAIAFRALMLEPGLPPIADALLERHFSRKHGPNAYYGQEPRTAG